MTEVDDRKFDVLRGLTPSVIIIGAGFGGIAAGVKLRKAGIDTFLIFEKSSGIGGTWWDNDYPGAEVDVGSHLYSYSFKRYDWTRTHARQAELQQYLEDVVDEFGLRTRLRLGTSVVRAQWDEGSHTYTVELASGATTTCDVLISAVGMLNVAQYPDWSGLDEFEGAKFHTSRWEHHHDLTGKRVAIVGTGSTASQVLPSIAPIAGHIALFQREPGWVVPKDGRDLTSDERVTFSSARAYRRERLRLLWQLQKGQIRGQIHRPGTKLNKLSEQVCRNYINAVFKDHPDLRQLVTPDFPFPGKRPVQTSDFYPALLRDNVDLIPHAVASVTPHGIVDTAGVEHPADVLVMATGFHPTNYLATFELVGRHGQSLHEWWGGEPAAFLGVTVPGFPNFFMLYGPNTNGGEIVSNLERQAEYAVRAVRQMKRRNITAIEVRTNAYDLYNRWLQRNMNKTAWAVSSNYYKTASGRIVTQWPYDSISYGVLTKILGSIAETHRTKQHAGTAIVRGVHGVFQRRRLPYQPAPRKVQADSPPHLHRVPRFPARESRNATPDSLAACQHVFMVQGPTPCEK
jgi:cation diffusion facilitator CzcD-associated flavoprotein CzcO